MKSILFFIVMRWAARISGLISVAFFLSFIFGEGMHDIRNGDSQQLMPFLPLLALAISGYFVSWLKEKTGGAMMVIGGLLLLLYLFYSQDYIIGLIYGLPFIIPGIIFYLLGSQKH